MISSGREKQAFAAIPAHGRQCHRPASGRTARPLPDQTERRPAILLAYHGQQKREALASFLRRSGYSVTPCPDGGAALTHISHGCFDLVVTGIVMPQTDGLELIRSLQRHNAPPPVVAVADTEDRLSETYLRSATLSGAFSTHSLPLDPGPFLSDVRWILKGRADVIRKVVW